MNENVVSLTTRHEEIGDDVSVKESRFVDLVGQTLEQQGRVHDLPQSLVDRVDRLRALARKNIEEEVREM